MMPIVRGGSPRKEEDITISEGEGVRYLHFGTPWVQGAMVLARPDLLVLDYVQRMMAWLLFLTPPPEILQLGLGAASLTRFAHARLAPARVTVIESSANVIRACRLVFALPAEGERLTIVQGDAQAVVQDPALFNRFGVIQVDLYDRDARGPTVDSLAFYRDCRRLLALPGICVINLFGSHPSYRPNLARIGEAFDQRILVLPANAAGNRIVLAFAGPPMKVRWDAVRERARLLESSYGWPATQWVDLLQGKAPAAHLEI